MLSDGGEPSAGGKTLRNWGEAVLGRRELDGHRAEKHDRNRWKHFIAGGDFIDWPLAAITRRDVKRWMHTLNDRRSYGCGAPRRKKGRERLPRPQQPLAWQTKKHVLVLLRKAFEAAIEDELGGDDFVNP